MKKWLISLSALLAVAITATVYSQRIEITCPDSQPVLVTEGSTVRIECATSTPSATSTPTVASTATPTPSPTSPLPTVTPTPKPPTATPRPTTPPPTPVPELAAFPGAEGFGTETVGGRGGKVYKVVNLNDSGFGSLRACVEAIGPRICVFDTGGEIVLQSSLYINNPYITIAGQTAPGDGITIRSPNSNTEAGMFVRTHDVIVRFLRFRPGTNRQDIHVIGVNAGGSATGLNAAHNVVLDHLSISWNGDEQLILYAQSHNITVQWSSISESLPAPQDGSVAIKGVVLGADNGPGQYTMHHNLLAHNHQRNPNVDVAGVLDYRNNVVYNWNYSGANLKLSPKVNLVGNYVKAGPNTASNFSFVKLTNFKGSFYVENNMVDATVKLVNFAPDLAVAVEHPAAYVTTDEPDIAYERVLQDAGNSRGLNCDGTWRYRPDAVDVRIAQSVRDGTRGHNVPVASTYNQLGYISLPSDVGGWPTLNPGQPCLDTDKDGMPNLFEEAVGFNPLIADDAVIGPNGWTRMDIYLAGR